jgi:hypothetical protein
MRAINPGRAAHRDHADEPRRLRGQKLPLMVNEIGRSARFSCKSAMAKMTRSKSVRRLRGTQPKSQAFGAVVPVLEWIIKM